MSKMFFDHLVDFDSLEKLIKHNIETAEEREELWGLIDEIIHHRVLGCIFDHLPTEHHKEFLSKLHRSPFDLGLLEYLGTKIQKDMEKVIKDEVDQLTQELLHFKP